MSSSAGFSSYSSLFASGLHTSGHHDLDVYPYHPFDHGLQDFPANVDARRPSAADTVSSRRSSLPTTFASDRRIGQNNSYYPPRALQESGIAFTPSILLRSDTNTTKRSKNYKSFLSMDANDPTTFPPALPSNLHNTSPSSPPNKRPNHARAVSVSSSMWAPSMLQAPSVQFILPPPVFFNSFLFSNYASHIDNDRHSIAGGIPSTTNAPSVRRSISVPSHKSTDTPPRLEIRLDPTSSRISFDPSAQHDVARRLAAASFTSGVSSAQSIPTRPEYEPRVRSSLPPSSTASIVPPLPPRSIQRNMSITSTTTFASATPSQRSAIRRVRRNEALARLEGNHYDPEPASASFMPFESDEEEEESEVDRSSGSNRRDTVLSPSKSPPPPIGPPSPLRYRNAEQRRFIEIDPPESLFELALSTIAEAPPPRTPSDNRAPSNQVHRSLWPAFEREEDDENTSPYLPSPHHNQQKHTHTQPSRTPAISPFSSRSNLTIHTSNNHSSTSLASFTPFSSTDYNRVTRPNSVHKASSGGSKSHLGSSQNSHSNSPYATTPAASIMTGHSISFRSNGPDEMSDEYEGEGESVDSHSQARHVLNRRDRDRSATISAGTSRPHYLTTSSLVQRQSQVYPAASAVPQQQQPSGDAWLRESLLAMAPAPGPAKSAKASAPSSTKSKEKDRKGKEDKIRYETYLDMSGDEKAAKKRRWLFGK